jgi:hypothetical protein
LHRHFVGRDDFEVLVAGTELAGCTASDIITLPTSRIGKRLRRTVFGRFLRNVDYLRNWYWLPSAIKRAARKWQPDLVFTVPDNLHAGWAWRLANSLDVPLVANFQDLFPLSRFIKGNQRPYPWVSRWLMDRFRRLHNQADLVLHTSEGMQDWFGKHPNGQVLYPIGSEVEVAQPECGRPRGRIVLVYAGNCYGAYGRMLLRLANCLSGHSRISFRIFAAGNDWSGADVDRLVAAGIYAGFVPFEKLRTELARADAYLTVMSFEPDEEAFVRTSFTTKWLDYAPCAKPVFVWAPAYSSAALFAKQNSCGIVVGCDEPECLVNSVEETMGDPERVAAISAASAAVAVGKLSASAIHGLLRDRIQALVPSI